MSGLGKGKTLRIARLRPAKEFGFTKPIGYLDTPSAADLSIAQSKLSLRLVWLCEEYHAIEVQQDDAAFADLFKQKWATPARLKLDRLVESYIAKGFHADNLKMGQSSRYALLQAINPASESAIYAQALYGLGLLEAIHDRAVSNGIGLDPAFGLSPYDEGVYAGQMFALFAMFEGGSSKMGPGKLYFEKYPAHEARAENARESSLYRSAMNEHLTSNPTAKKSQSVKALLPFFESKSTTDIEAIKTGLRRAYDAETKSDISLVSVLKQRVIGTS